MMNVWTSGQTKGGLRDEIRRLPTTAVMILKQNCVRLSSAGALQFPIS
jgi:hypothetical protein